MDERLQFHKNYKDNEVLRAGFNQLATKTFSLTFESWYQNGYWQDRFNPHTIFDGGKAVSNISTYEMTFDWNGKLRHYVQLGGVMTDEAYRHQGLSRYLMEHILEEYKDKADGIFLMANDSVLNFYPKFGFQKRIEWQCSKELHQTTEVTARQVPMTNKEEWGKLEDAIEKSVRNGIFEMKHNASLIMFYVTQFMQENVYYLENLDAYVIAELEADRLNLLGVFAEKIIDLDEVYQAFGKEVNHVVLKFTPLEKEQYEQNEIAVADDTLFVIGKDFDEFDVNKIMFPVLSHT